MKFDEPPPAGMAPWPAPAAPPAPALAPAPASTSSTAPALAPEAAEAAFRQDMIASMLQRMQAVIDLAAEHNTTPGKKIDYSMYTKESIQQRIELLSNPQIIQALEDLWQAARALHAISTRSP